MKPLEGIDHSSTKKKKVHCAAAETSLPNYSE